MIHDDLQDGLLSPSFTVYRKPTFTGVSIHSNSWHPTTQKLAVIRAAVNRMFILPLTPEAEECEIRMIESIATTNGLKVDVRLFIRRQRLHNYLRESRSHPDFDNFAISNFCKPISKPINQKEIWMRLPYLGKATELLERELKRYGYRVGFYPLTKVLDLSTLKDKIPVFEKSGIYSLRCTCGDSYIGQSRRCVSERFKEHKWDFDRFSKNIVKGETCSSAMALHCLEKGHSYDGVHPQLLHPCEKGTRMNRLEELYTIKAVIEARSTGSNVLNDMEAVFFNNFIRYVLKYDH